MTGRWDEERRDIWITPEGAEVWLPELTPDEAARGEYERPGPPFVWTDIAVIKEAETILAAETDRIGDEVAGALQVDAEAACAAASAAAAAVDLEQDAEPTVALLEDAPDNAAGAADVDE